MKRIESIKAVTLEILKPIGIGRCTLWLRNELDSVNRLNNKLPHNIDESACEHYFSKGE